MSNKYHGFVGYANFVETSTDVYQEEITEKEYDGDVLKNSKKWQATEYLNPDLTVHNKISILADPYAYEHFHAIRYCTWGGVKWVVTDVEVSYPRLILSLGGVYNEQTKTKQHTP